VFINLYLGVFTLKVFLLYPSKLWVIDVGDELSLMTAIFSSRLVADSLPSPQTPFLYFLVLLLPSRETAADQLLVVTQLPSPTGDYRIEYYV
jgi:hypothetical protein